jgi:hypothetical protein
MKDKKAKRSHNILLIMIRQVKQVKQVRPKKDQRKTKEITPYPSGIVRRRHKSHKTLPF